MCFMFPVQTRPVSAFLKWKFIAVSFYALNMWLLRVSVLLGHANIRPWLPLTAFYFPCVFLLRMFLFWGGFQLNALPGRSCFKGLYKRSLFSVVWNELNEQAVVSDDLRDLGYDSKGFCWPQVTVGKGISCMHSSLTKFEWLQIDSSITGELHPSILLTCSWCVLQDIAWQRWFSSLVVQS